MEIHTELAKRNPHKKIPEWLLGSVEDIITQLQQQAAETIRQTKQEAIAKIKLTQQQAAETIKQRETQIKHRDTELHAANIKIQSLVLELAHLRRMRYGAKNEAIRAQTRDLFEETLATDIAAIESELANQSTETVAAPSAPRSPKVRSGRQPLPAHLPRVLHCHEPASCQCGQCGQDLVKIGEDVSEQLDVVPAKFFVHRHIRPQYACRRCETISAAPIPAAVIDGGMAAAGLLTWVVISKYLDHLPLYRLEQIAARSDVPLARSTLAEWVGRIGVALQPLAARMKALLCERQILHADETPVAQLDPGKGKTKRAYLWAYRTNVWDTGPPIVVFDYQSSRSGRHVRHFLQDWQGHLMVDDYAGYKELFAHGVTELACLAHARRKFFDLNAAQPNPIAQEALIRIARLYEIEGRGKDLSTNARTALRQAEAMPVLQALHDWLLKTRMTVAHGGSTAKALDYTLRRWTALARYAADGRLPIDNNPVENIIRPIAIGKKNWLFAGSERAGQRAAAIQSLLATAKLNGLDPAAWLKSTLEKLPTCLNSQIDTLLPLRNESVQEIVTAG